MKKRWLHYWSHYFKEAERREVREDFARCRSDKQNGFLEVVENNGLW
jgi:hypothetical protein